MTAQKTIKAEMDRRRHVVMSNFGFIAKHADATFNDQRMPSEFEEQAHERIKQLSVLLNEQLAMLAQLKGLRIALKAVEREGVPESEAA